MLTATALAFLQVDTAYTHIHPFTPGYSRLSHTGKGREARGTSVVCNITIEHRIQKTRIYKDCNMGRII